MTQMVYSCNSRQLLTKHLDNLNKKEGFDLQDTNLENAALEKLATVIACCWLFKCCHNKPVVCITAHCRLNIITDRDRKGERVTHYSVRMRRFSFLSNVRFTCHNLQGFLNGFDPLPLLLLCTCIHSESSAFTFSD